MVQSVLDSIHLYTFQGDLMVDRAVRFWSVGPLFLRDIQLVITSLAWKTIVGNRNLIGTDGGVAQLWRVRKKADYTPENPFVGIS